MLGAPPLPPGTRSSWRNSLRRWLLAAVISLSGLVLVTGAARAQTTRPNILLIIADDVGVESIEAYRETFNGIDGHPHTPTLNALAAQGVRFRHAWANPLCGAARATMQTGRYGHRTGILGSGGTLSAAELSLPEALATQGYASALIGKWGLSDAGEARQVVQSGYDHFAGTPSAVLQPFSYFGWRRHVATFAPARAACRASRHPVTHENADCIEASSAVLPEQDPASYATTRNVSDATDWIRQHRGQPWFLVLSFNAPHTPVHAPPDALHDVDAKALLPAGSCSPGLCYRAMVEAMDEKIGELLAWLRNAQELDRTVVIFVSDNGPEEFVAADPERSKYTLFEGGVNVPLIVKGPGVVAGKSGEGRVSDALINTTDLYMTVLELAGVAPCEIPGDHDSYSFVPILAGVTGEIRHYAYAEVLSSRAGKAIRNRAGLKLQRSIDGQAPAWFLFDLAKDPEEKHNLFDEEGQAPSALQAEVARLKVLLGDENVSKAAVPPPRLPAANLDPDADGVVGPIVEGRACRSDLRAYDLGPP